jgi:hypothetical protein
MESKIRDMIINQLQERIEEKIEITDYEWKEAKRLALLDAYANNFCFIKDVTVSYFVNMMVSILYLFKRKNGIEVI